MIYQKALLSLFISSVSAAALLSNTAAAQDIDFDIEAGTLKTALEAYINQSGDQLLYRIDDVQGVPSNGLKGAYEPEAALEELLADTGFTVIRDASGAAALAPTQEPSRPAEIEVVGRDATQDDAETLEESREVRGLAETIVVRGTRNAGVRRFEDDPQPYVVFDREDILSSQASNLEDFFRTRLPQNTQATSNRQFTTSSSQSPGNVSAIDLRGLGGDETLILINGRRAPRVNVERNFSQADINGIPLGSVERIEILPSTASGIYGGGATGGVVNIITKRDYVGAELQLEYGNTFDTDVGSRRIEGSFGFALEGGKTNVLITGAYSDSNDMLARDRPFALESRELLFRNNPDALAFGAYGSTTNIIGVGGNLILLDGTDLGSDRTFVPVGYEGITSDGGQALIDNAEQLNLTPPESFDGLGQRIIQAPTTKSASIAITRDFTPSVEAFVDASIYTNEGQGRSSALPRSAFLSPGQPGNPFQNFVSLRFPAIGPTLPSFNSSETIQLVGGVTWDFWANWSVTADYSWSRSRYEQEGSSLAFDIFGPSGIEAAIRNGGLDVFRDVTAFPLDLSPFAYTTPSRITGPRDTVLENYAIRVSGPAFELPAGRINTAFLAETRQEQLNGSFQDRIIRGSPPPGTFETVFKPEREQSVDSFYAEALVPLFSQKNKIALIEALDLQLSVRYDSYETISPDNSASIILASRNDPVPDFETVKNTFSSIDYTVGIRYQPVEDIVFRASFSTGFVPPNVSQIFPRIETDDGVFLQDPLRENSPGAIIIDTVQSVGNPNLRPEESESWSVGVILTPRVLPGFRLSIDYTLIDKTDEISGISNQDLFNLESSFPDRIVRAPLTPEDELLGYTGGRIVFFNSSAINLANSESEAVDIQLDQTIETEKWGTFQFYSIATYMSKVTSQILPDSEVRDPVGFDGGPLEWRAVAGLTWTSPNSDWTLGWNSQYYDDYLVYRNTDRQSRVDDKIRDHGRESIPSEIYHDVTVVYRPTSFSQRFGGVLEDLEVRLGVQNVFNKEPALRPASSSFDLIGRYSPYGDVRMRRYTIALRKSF